jgi:opacity protein-like surface antigen
LNNSQYDTGGLTLSPNSELAFTFHVGDFAFTIRDSFALLNDPVSLVTLSNGSGMFRRFVNNVSISSDWLINPLWDIAFGYNHYNLWSLGSGLQPQYEIPDQAIDTIFITPSYRVGPGITVGLNASMSWMNDGDSTQLGSDPYNPVSVNHSGMSYSLGPFVKLDLTKNTRISLGGGYQGSQYNNQNYGLDSGNNSSYYLLFSVDNRLNDFYSQRFAFSHTTEPGYDTNYYDLYYMEYAGNWRATPSLCFDPRLLFEHYTTSGSGSETANVFGAEIGTRYMLTPSVTLGLSYRFYDKVSNISANSAYQNSIMFNIYYSF